ncbi:MAG: glycyl-radical enzyme activating protein [Oscillospiraceae bacterium]|nr:glycyl-radical enzyme activating protein [Oscillospiraceae bacterium]
MATPYVFNVQKYSIHDGDGIRTTIFFKGCPINCAWCHNPESQRFDKELLYFKDRCTGCGKCVQRCPNGANTIVDGKAELDRSKCNACGICADWCITQARDIAGKEYTVKELVKEAEKDRQFYEESGGGITLSGGEVMSQDMDYIEQLCKILHNKGYSVNIDTCGYAPYEDYKRILPYVDTFLYDIKAMDKETHEKFIGVDNTLILENLKKLSADGARINIRIPTVVGVNATEEFMNDVVNFLKGNNISVAQVNLLPYHNTGKHKYSKLDREYDTEGLMEKPSAESMELFKNIFVKNGFNNTKIGG